MAAERLKAELRKLGRAKASTMPEQRRAVDISPGCAFGAVVDQRLKDLERSLGEFKTRLNGLIFVVIGAVLLEIVLRLFA